MPPKFRRKKTLSRTRRRQRGGTQTSTSLSVPLSDTKTMLFPQTLTVSLGDGSAANNQIVPPQVAKAEPQISWVSPPDPFYTLMVIDPDAPAKPSWLHWLIANMDGSSTATGDTLVPWAPPSPPSGIHRYYALLFRHEARVIADAPKERGYFKPTEFMRVNGLQPVAAAMWRVRAEGPNPSTKPL